MRTTDDEWARRAVARTLRSALRGLAAELLLMAGRCVP